MYWIDWGLGTIHCAGLDGSNVETLVTGLSSPQGIAVDAEGGKMYWTIGSSGGRNEIYRANLDGSQVEDLVNVRLSLAGFIALGIEDDL